MLTQVKINQFNQFKFIQILGCYNSTPLRESRPRDEAVLTQTTAGVSFSIHRLFPKLPLLPSTDSTEPYTS